jgi:CRP-like cAMP-binding protein
MSLVSSDTAPEHLLGNSLLVMLSPADRMLLAADLTRVECKPLQRLFRAGEDVVAAYFPLEGCTIALSVGLADGRDVHVGLIGREGAVGGIVSGGNKPGFATAVVETGGPALTLSHNDLQRAKSKSASLVEQFASYADCLFAQAMQTAACNAFHSAEQRLARWLLFLQDRVSRHDIPVTQDRLGAIIGAHRVTVLRGLRPLQDSRLIEMRRGRVVVLDREGLERMACECRSAIEAHYRRMLPGWHLQGAGEAPAEGPAHDHEAE